MAGRPRSDLGQGSRIVQARRFTQNTALEKRSVSWACRDSSVSSPVRISIIV